MNITTGKTSLSRLLGPALALGTLLCSFSLAAAQEPVLGTWEWENSRQDFTLLPDGTAREGGHAGTWVCTNATANPRVYQINWEKGLVLDTLYLVQGGTQLIGQNQTVYNLRATRIQSAVTPAPAEVVAMAPVDYVEQLAQQLPHAQEWVFAPLDAPVPDSVRQAFNNMDTTLQAQAPNVPAAEIEVYRQGWGAWRELMSVWHEREAWLRRNYELNHGAGFPESWKAAWAERARLVESHFAASYTPFQEAVRLHPHWAAAGLAGESRKFSAPAASFTIARYEHHAAEEAAHHLGPVAQGPSHLSEIAHPEPTHGAHAAGHRPVARKIHGHR